MKTFQTIWNKCRALKHQIIFCCDVANIPLLLFLSRKEYIPKSVSLWLWKVLFNPKSPFKVKKNQTSNRQPTHFLILAEPRTGSNWLSSLLSSHPNAKVLPEPFHPKGEGALKGLLEKENIRMAIRYRKTYPVAFLREALVQVEQEELIGVGIKEFYNRLKKFDVLNELSAWRVIRLERENLLEQAVSYWIALKTNKWSGSNTSLDSVKIPFQWVQNFFTKQEQIFETKNQWLKNTSYLEVKYESLLRDSERDLVRIQNFLDLPFSPLTSQWKKQNLSKMPQKIVNYEALKKGFRDTKWSMFFN